MPDISSFFSFGFDAIQDLLSSSFAGVAEWWTGIQWSDLYGWLNLPSDIAQAITVIIGFFSLFCVIGFVRKIIIFFG